MTEQQNPIERAVDLFVFAPIGVAMFAKDTVPTFLRMFVSRGQTELQQRKKLLHMQANQYRAVGKFAVRYGGPEVRRQAESKLDEAVRRAEETFSGLIVSRGDDDPGESPAPPTAPTPPREPVVKIEKPAQVEPAAARSGTVANRATVTGATNGHAKNGEHTNGKVEKPAKSAPAKVSPTQTAASLAIPEYDQLSASQVVERLDGLTPEELDAVRAYELAHRGRSTILGKITQLTS